jgi:hypothetical protein
MESVFPRHVHLGLGFQAKAHISWSGRYLYAVTQDNKIQSYRNQDLIHTVEGEEPSQQAPRQVPWHSRSIAEGSTIYDLVSAPWPATGYFVSVPDSPIQLHGLWSSSDSQTEPENPDSAKVLASFNFKDDKLESWHTAYLNLAANDKPWLIAGGNRFLRVYDVEQGRSEPIHSQRLSICRNAGGSSLLKGCVSALDANEQGLLAVGTFERRLGIFAENGVGGIVQSTCLGSSAREAVSQLKWSRARPWYLYVARRHCDVICVHDVRMNRSYLDGNVPVAELKGRMYDTHQRLAFDVLPSDEMEYVPELDQMAGSGEWIVAGGSDGKVVGWSYPWAASERYPEMEVQVNSHPVTAVVVHPDGALITGCGGDRYRDGRRKNGWDEVTSDEESDDTSDVESDRTSTDESEETSEDESVDDDWE